VAAVVVVAAAACWAASSGAARGPVQARLSIRICAHHARASAGSSQSRHLHQTGSAHRGRGAHPAIGGALDDTTEDRTEVRRRILDAAKGSFSGALELVVVEPDDTDPVGRHMVEKVDPFYDRDGDPSDFR
jgi:hypothetical protein